MSHHYRLEAAKDQGACELQAYLALDGTLHSSVQVQVDRVFGEFILRYDDMRTAEKPEEALLAFAQSTYAAAAELGGWPRADLERPPAKM